MEYILLIIALFVLLETSFLTYQQLRRNTKRTSTAIYVDTSVLIDGRIVDIAKTGFITAQLVIPRSVIGELQLLSDGADHDKRARARHGLDVARELRTMDTVDVHLLQDGSTAEEGVDERLLNLAKKHGGMICTIDYNLNKVAQVEGIRVLNINELAKSIRMEFLPGERQSLALIQKGQNAQQAVGYTADGTMVVVDGATKRIGTTVDVEIVRSIQTDAGRMLFAKLIEPKKATTAASPTLLPAKAQQVAKLARTTKTKTAGRKPAATPAPTPKPKATTAPAATRAPKATPKPRRQTRSSRSTVSRVATPEPAATKPPQATAKASTKATSTKAAKNTTRVASTRTRSSRRRPRTNEDRLIDLVDKQ
ncbi:hypothetical protein HG440_001065 [Candidatus Saccharibacteria bacterium]|nr:hypothetical protein [Candidatus Saccharibacteria bacterium]